jgi:hypothetical protein
MAFQTERRVNNLVNESGHYCSFLASKETGVVFEESPFIGKVSKALDLIPFHCDL